MTPCTISVPEAVCAILETLERAGFESYAVGGCVRDSLLGLAPHDWDFCTAARPEQVKACFADRRVLDTGIRHGTVTVLIEHTPYEITTFRTDGAYSDHRRPDSVAFTGSLREDLSRRDFTVNAMAYSPARGLADFFGGRQDLAARRIRCVGRAERRFEEDALRILRALRFAAVYGFTVEEETARALRETKMLLAHVAAERVRAEFCRLLCGPAAPEILREFFEVIAVCLPEVAPMLGFDQRNPHHCYDVWEHTLAALSAAPPELAVRLAVLFHDAGKPSAFAPDADGVGHFPGHAKRSAALAEQAMKRLRFDNAALRRVTELVLHHDIPISPEPALVRRRLNQFGADALRQLLAVQRADASAKAPAYRAESVARAEETARAVEQILAAGDCLTLRGLAVNGRDLIALGVPEGPQVGRALDALLRRVLDGTLANERKALLDAARENPTE